MATRTVIPEASVTSRVGAPPTGATLRRGELERTPANASCRPTARGSSEGPLTRRQTMSTLRLSIVAATLLAAEAFTFAQTAGGPPGCCQGASKPPTNARAEHTRSDTCVLPLAGAPAAQPDKDEQDPVAPAAAKVDFSVEGMFVDCCSCRPPCPCEVTEVMKGCVGVGAHQISTGRYAGNDLAGVKIAHAKVVGEWVNLYVDVPDEKQWAAAEKFGRAMFAGFGPIKEVKAAKIEFSGANGKYAVTVDGGKIMRLETEPVLGGDGKTPVGYTNIKNAVNPNVYQGKCVFAAYTDGDKKLTVEKGRNSHFNPMLKSSGKI
ncbi:MAG TPA: hypothetical protein VFZ65_23755 [Planctomycetota bacterium]|nr:hypothetical protein [Planctomycetota bacterium]